MQRVPFGGLTSASDVVTSSERGLIVHIGKRSLTCRPIPLWAISANSGDSALIVSKGLHAEKRAGDAEVPLIVPGVETIDCSRIEDSLAGHSYYGDNRDVTTDLFMLLKEDLPPSKRFFLKEQEFRGNTYWQFNRHAPKIMCTWHFEEQR